MGEQGERVIGAELDCVGFDVGRLGAVAVFFVVAL